MVAISSKGGKNPMQKKESLPLDIIAQNFVVEYVTPLQITESASAEGSSKPVHIKGTAIDETISYNNIKYVKEELKKAAPTLGDVPILKDHENKIGSLVGRTTESVFMENPNKIDFEGDIMDPGTKEMLKDGRIRNVSIGAKVQKLRRENQNDMNSPLIAEGITFLELSLVPVQGVKNATISHAIFEKFGDGKMVEEKTEVVEETPTETKTVVEKTPEVVQKPEPVPMVSKEAFDGLLKEMQSLKEEMKAVKEKPKSKGVVSTAINEVAPKDDLIRERTRDGLSFYGSSEELIYGKKEKR